MCRTSQFLLLPVLAAVQLLCVSGCRRGSDEGGDGLVPAPPRAVDRTPLVPADELSETVILPHLDGPITSGTNYIYCATFQLAWNELRDNIVKAPIELDGGPSWTTNLNKASFNKSDLSQDSYLARGGFVRDGVVGQIRKEMEERFPEASFDVPEPSDQTVAYTFAYLAKYLAFPRPFENVRGELEFPLQGKTTSVSAFGTEYFCDWELLRQVTILDYTSDDDFILSLETGSDRDQIVLAKVQPSATLRATIGAVEKRIGNSTLTPQQKAPQMGESLIVPVIQLSTVRSYDELIDKHFLNAGFKDCWIGQANQGIRFRLDEFGARLESYAETTTCTSASVEEPRRFHFDKPFLLYLKERSASGPYFAMWVETAEVLEREGGSQAANEAVSAADEE